MAKLKWTSLLRMPELEWLPGEPAELPVAAEIVQTLSWLTGATKHDRRFIRCDENGALLIAAPWANLSVVATDELAPDTNTPDGTGELVANHGVLVATSTMIVKVSFVRVSGGDAEDFYVPPGEFLFYPYPTYSVTATVVPSDTGVLSYVGVTVLI